MFEGMNEFDLIFYMISIDFANQSDFLSRQYKVSYNDKPIWDISSWLNPLLDVILYRPLDGISFGEDTFDVLYVQRTM